MNLEEKINKLPLELKQETEDFVDFLLKKRKIKFDRDTQNNKRKLGTLSGTVESMSPDFDEPLNIFEDYMP